MPEKPEAPLSKLPSGGEFSPGQIDLREALEIVAAHVGNRAATTEALREEWFTDAAATRIDPVERLAQQRKLAGNVIIGMSTYGLYDPMTQGLTALGEELRATQDDKEMYAKFGRHILRDRQGLTVLKAVRNLQKRRERPTKTTIANELQRLGLHPPRATTHHLVLLNWLRKAGVLEETTGYVIDEDRAGILAGIELRDADDWGAFTAPQRAFVRTLRQLAQTHGASPIAAQTVLDTAEATLGPVFRGVSDRLSERVFDPLVEQGWIARSGPTGGRGGKSGAVAATEKLLASDLGSLPSEVGSAIPVDVRAKLNTPLADIYRDLGSADTGRKGIALELLAMHIATDLGLTPLFIRLRGKETGGAEVDVVAEGVHLHFSRWLFQCKNVPGTVRLHDLAKEVGMCVLLRAQVVVMVTTGMFSSEVKRYADSLAETTVHQVVLVDKTVLARYRKNGATALQVFFQGSAAETMRLKRSQLDAESDLGGS
jgi:hypothetical protein